MRVSKLLLFVGGLAAYGGGVVLASKWYGGKEKPDESGSLPSEKERRDIFNRLAPVFDEDINLHEKLSGISGLRRKLVAAARGDVLEVAVGTGRNFEYYPADCHVTGVDFSEQMLKRASQKLASNIQKAQSAKIKLVPADGQSLPFSNGTFDTVVDTFGLCSIEDPAAALKEMQRVVKSDGKILLLEHGQSSYDWLSRFMTNRLSRHVERYGCYWNRDIEGLVRQSGLKIVSLDKTHFGTTVSIIATKNPRAL